MMSENEILQAASQAKTVLDALYGLLSAIDQKTGFEQRAADAETRYNAASQKEIDKLDELESMQKKIDFAGEDAEAAKAYADKIISDAQTRADNTRAIAANEAGLVVQSAQAQASQILSDLADRRIPLEADLTAKQNELNGLQSFIDSKTAELNRVQGDLDAAKDEIRRKFLA